MWNAKVFFYGHFVVPVDHEVDDLFAAIFLRQSGSQVNLSTLNIRTKSVRVSDNICLTLRLVNGQKPSLRLAIFCCHR